jgi:deoxyribose-phosphate aldolase
MVSVTWLEGFDPSYVFKSKIDFKNWLLSHIDLTYLPPYLSNVKLNEFLTKALEYGFKQVCIPITSIPAAKKIIAEKDLKFITFLSSFHGNRNLLEEKTQACKSAIDFQVNEIEFSPNLSLAEDDGEGFKTELQHMVTLIRENRIISKVYLEIDKLPEKLISKVIQLCQENNPDYISIFIRLLEEETYDGENLNLSKEWFEKVNNALGSSKKTGLKVYGRIDSFNNLLPILFLATKYGWDLDDLRIGTEYGFDILDGLDVSN